MSIDEDRQRYIMKTLSQAVHELFEDYGLDCTVTQRLSDAPPGFELGSMIGFEGGAFSGALALVAPDALVEQMLPVPAVPERAAFQIRDWGGEMANQLLGRLKNKLTGTGNDFSIGTPIVMRGLNMRLSLLPDAYGTALRFSIASAKAGVRVYLDCTVCEVAAPSSKGPASSGSNGSENAGGEAVPEGGLLFF